MVPLDDLARGMVEGGDRIRSEFEGAVCGAVVAHDDANGSLVHPGSDVDRLKELGDVQLLVEGGDYHLDGRSFGNWIDLAVVYQPHQAQEDSYEEEHIGRTRVRNRRCEQCILAELGLEVDGSCHDDRECGHDADDHDDVTGQISELAPPDGKLCPPGQLKAGEGDPAHDDTRRSCIESAGSRPVWAPGGTRS